MDRQILGENLARLRGLRGLSQATVAEAAGISRQAYRSLEQGLAEPRTATLSAIAGALRTPVTDLLRPVRSLSNVRFRDDRKMATRTQVLSDVAQWLDDYRELEDLLDSHVNKRLANCARSPEPEACARVARKRFQLGTDDLIRDICGLLEDNGVKVFLPSLASEGFFGLSVGAKDGGPAIVVNTWERVSVERWIFSAAHELGHLMLHLDAYDVQQVDQNESEEKEADLFASHFLMPREVFRREWDEARGRPLVDRVFKLKQMFRVSYKTVLYRVAEETGDKDLWMRFYSGYKRRFGRGLRKVDEPEPLKAGDFGPAPAARGAEEPERVRSSAFMDDRLWSLVRRAVEEQHISMSRGAEILRLDTRQMRQVVNGWVG